jgi:diguanylate cyclase (GGDEF)-like protein
MPELRVRISAWAIVLCLGWPAQGGAAHAVDWSALSNTVFRHVATLRDLQTHTAPLAFAEDKRGFLWAGGEDGLFRWDGYQFRYYTASGSPNDGLRNHYIWVLHTDRAGTLWAGTNSGGLARYDDATDRFIPVMLADSRGEATKVWSLDDDGVGGLWAGTNRGVAHLDARGHVVPPAGPSASSAPALTVFAAPDRKVEAVAIGRQGLLWIGGAGGLARIGPDGRATPVTLPTADGTVPQVSRLMQDGAGRIWIGTRHHGAYMVDPATLRARTIPLPAGLVSQDGDVEIMAMAEIEPGRMWLATFGQGIIDVDAATMASRAIVHDPMVPDSPGSNVIFGLHTDRSGITWISNVQSLEQFVPPAGAIHTLFGNPARQGGIPTDVTAVLARPDGSVWLGSQSDGVLILGTDGKPARTLPVARVFCVAEEANGPVYIGTRSGLFEASPNGDHVRKLEIASRRPNASVFSLLVADGVVWLGGVDDDGLWELRPSGNGPLAVARHFDAPPLPNATVTYLGLAPGGLLAVGTARGAALLNRITGAMETIVPDPHAPQSIAAGEIISGLTDRTGRLWLGSNEAGISVMLGRDARGHPLFHHITASDGLPDPDMGRMLADEAGRVWVSTDNGLAMIDPDSFEVHALKDADGVAIATYWSASGARTPSGDLIFGGVGGATVVQPGTLKPWQYKPPVSISEIHVGGKSVRSRGPELVIPPNANSLAIEFTALDFSVPNENQYRYKLEGFDPDFTATDSRHRVASYTNLPPGSYTLRLQGSNRNGVWAEPTTLKILVLAAWFQTWFVRCAEAAALLLAGGGLTQGRMVWMRRRQRYLESLVQERTAELVSSQQKLTQLAYFDTLTALPNRRFFNQTMQERLAPIQGLPSEFALILIDLDGFKRVNDTLGHDAGDDLLVVAAGRLRAALREGDFVARLGGDEFAIILTRIIDCDLVAHVCDRVVTGMTAPIELKSHPVRIGASVGVALSPRDGATAEDVYKHADQALYQAKRSGKGIWCWYNYELAEAALAAPALIPAPGPTKAD